RHDAYAIGQNLQPRHVEPTSVRRLAKRCFVRRLHCCLDAAVQIETHTRYDTAESGNAIGYFPTEQLQMLFDETHGSLQGNGDVVTSESFGNGNERSVFDFLGVSDNEDFEVSWYQMHVAYPRSEHAVD